MICTKCNTNGKLIEFQTFKYYYCHNCKDEIKLEEVKHQYQEGTRGNTNGEFVAYDKRSGGSDYALDYTFISDLQSYLVDKEDTDLVYNLPGTTTGRFKISKE